MRKKYSDLDAIQPDEITSSSSPSDVMNEKAYPDTIASSVQIENAQANQDAALVKKRRRSSRLSEQQHSSAMKNLHNEKEKKRTKSKKVKIKREVKVKSEPRITPDRIPSNNKVQRALKLSQTVENNNLLQLQSEFRAATIGLGKLHPHVIDQNDDRRKTLLEACGMRNSITDSIISTMLSQNTTDKNSKAAWRNLKRIFPTWENVLDLDENDLSKLEDSIRVAGLAKTRSERIYAMLKKVKENRGAPCFNYLTEMSDEDVKKDLSKFKGLGPKTISCVLLFALARPEFPVDTHVLRISKQMKWIPQSSSRESAYELMNEIVPSEIKMDFHCLLVTHGKHCHHCAANNRPQFPPEDGSKLVCPLLAIQKTRKMLNSKIVAISQKDALKNDVLIKTEI